MVPLGPSPGHQTSVNNSSSATASGTKNAIVVKYTMHAYLNLHMVKGMYRLNTSIRRLIEIWMLRGNTRKRLDYSLIKFLIQIFRQKFKMAGFTFKLRTKYITNKILLNFFADLYTHVTKTRDKQNKTSIGVPFSSCNSNSIKQGYFSFYLQADKPFQYIFQIHKNYLQSNIRSNLMIEHF